MKHLDTMEFAELTKEELKILKEAEDMLNNHRENQTEGQVHCLVITSDILRES